MDSNLPSSDGYELCNYSMDAKSTLADGYEVHRYELDGFEVDEVEPRHSDGFEARWDSVDSNRS